MPAFETDKANDKNGHEKN